MANEETGYRTGDWIVHCYHGVGQIKDKEDKVLGGEKRSYYRVEMFNSTLWIPEDRIKDSEIRGVSDEEAFNHALDALKEPPEGMDDNLNRRKSQIEEVVVENTPLASARMIRDLWARRRKKGGLGDAESRALRMLQDRLAQELAVTSGIELEEADQEVESILREGLEPVE